MPLTAIVIVSYGSLSDLPECLSTLLTSVAGQSVKIGLVENHPDEKIRQQVYQASQIFFKRGVQWLPAPGNLGYGGGANFGWQQLGSADFYLVLNPDMTFPTDWLAKLLTPFEQDSQIGVVGCKLLTRDQKIQHAGGLLRPDLALAEHFGYGEPDDSRFDQSCEVEFVTGAALALSHKAYVATGGFDPAFFPGYFEDVDLCYRARAANFKVWYEASALAYHYEGGSFGRGESYYQNLHRSRLRFVLKHFDTARLLQEFVPAESARLRGTLDPADRRVSQQVYRAAAQTSLAKDKSNEEKLLKQEKINPNLPATASDAEVTELAERLEQHAQNVKQGWLVEEKPFRSKIPFVAKLRDKFNSISTRWYVQPILAQQVEYNAAVSRAIEDLSKLAAGNLVTGDLQTATLAARMLTLENRLERIEKLLEKISKQTTES